MNAIKQFRLRQLQKEIEVGIRQADKGDLTLLDIEAIKSEGRRRLAAKANQHR